MEDHRFFYKQKWVPISEILKQFDERDPGFSRYFATEDGRPLFMDYKRTGLTKVIKPAKDATAIWPNPYHYPDYRQGIGS